MKKLAVLLLIFFMVATVVFAVPAPSVPVGVGKNAQNVQKTIDKTIPIGDDGKIDYSKYKPFKTGADEKIDKVNLWLDENVGWMKFIFYMKPEISILFFVNVYIILFFLTNLVLNAKGLWFFIENDVGKFFFGFAVFFALLVAKLYIGIAKIILLWINYTFSSLLPGGIIFGILYYGFIIFLGFFFPKFTKLIESKISTYLDNNRKKKERMEMKASTEAVDAMIDQIRRD